MSAHGDCPASSVLSVKQTKRRELSGRRRSLSAHERGLESHALTAQVPTLAIGDRVVCGYVPCGTEPGSLEFVAALADACSALLLPIVTGPSPLDWALYEGPESLAPAAFGLLEPRGERLGPAAIARADIVLVPALAIDVNGIRLGRGGGHYDRSLPAARRDAQLIAVVRDEEVVDALPAEPHDVRIGWVLTPHAGLRRLL